MALSDYTERRLQVAVADHAAANELVDAINGDSAQTFTEDVTLDNGVDLVLGTGTGTKIGTLTTQKLGFYNATPVAQPAALTAQLTTITPADAEGTPDYAIAAITNSSPFGFASAQEAITVLYVIRNLQVRLAEAEARLESLGLVTAN